jgi:hypothetical protein
MPDTAAALAEFRKYGSMLDSMIPADPAFAPTRRARRPNHVERGIVLPRVMKGSGDGASSSGSSRVTSGARSRDSRDR